MGETVQTFEILKYQVLLVSPGTNQGNTVYQFREFFEDSLIS